MTMLMEHLVFKMHSKCLHGHQSTQLCLPCPSPALGRQLLPKKSEPKQRQEATATRSLANSPRYLQGVFFIVTC